MNLTPPTILQVAIAGIRNHGCEVMNSYHQQLMILQEELAENRGIKGRLYFLECIRQLAQERMSNLQDEIYAKGDEIDAMETELAEMRQVWEVADEY